MLLITAKQGVIITNWGIDRVSLEQAISSFSHIKTLLTLKGQDCTTTQDWSQMY